MDARVAPRPRELDGLVSFWFPFKAMPPAGNSAVLARGRQLVSGW